jgi:4-diphosphocytidyl-2C-methyl-D-erythritol kinase
MTTGVQRGERPATTARTVAQAKINLLLRILAREAGGYHQLETLFCRLELGDDVVVRTAVRGRSLDCAGNAIPSGGLGPVEANLAWRAASAYADATGWPNDWAIEIGKRVPVGGGLGGGSADAGAVLRCLNALAPAPISGAALLGLAGPLGADVPFLTLEAPLALGWGRGERLLTLPALPPRHVALACFAFGVDTREAYGWVDTERGGALPEPGVLGAEALATWDGIARLAHNDFEMVVAPRHPEIAGALSGLRAAAAATGDATAITLLAGSGSTVAFLSRDSADVATHLIGGGAVRMVHTHTATRVVAVEVSD